MMRKLINTSLRLRVLVTVIAAGILVAGVTQLRDARVDLHPEFTPTIVEIQTEALGLSAKEVEQLITSPMEADLLNGVAWLDDIRSESVPGLSSVVMTFEPGTPLYQARQVVQERMAQAFALPGVSKPPQMLQPVSSTSRTMMIGLSSKTLSLIDISRPRPEPAASSRPMPSASESSTYRRSRAPVTCLRSPFRPRAATVRPARGCASATSPLWWKTTSPSSVTPPSTAARAL
jgi:hypothetical protein